MVENLGLLEIRHAGANVFYADIEYQPNILVPTAPTGTPSTTFVPSTMESVEADPTLKMPKKVSSQAKERLDSFADRFLYPSEEQSTRLAVALGYDVTLIKLWCVAHQLFKPAEALTGIVRNRFEGKQRKVKTAKIAPRSRLLEAVASLKESTVRGGTKLPSMF